MRFSLSLLFTASILWTSSLSFASSMQQDDDNDVVGKAVLVSTTSSSTSTAEPSTKKAKKERFILQAELFQDAACKALRALVHPASIPIKGVVEEKYVEFDCFSLSSDGPQKQIFFYLLVNDIRSFKALRGVSKHFHSLSAHADLRNLTWEIFADQTGNAEHFNTFHAPLYKALPLPQLWNYLEKGIFKDELGTNGANDYWYINTQMSTFDAISRGYLMTPIDTQKQLDAFDYEGIFPPVYHPEAIKDLLSVKLVQNPKVKKIRHIDVAHLTSLKELIIDGTLIQSVGGLTALTQLESLDLANNPNLEVGREIETLTNLWNLTLSIQRWNPELNFNKLINLRCLSFGWTTDLTIPNISGLMKLECLHLEGSDIEALPNLRALPALSKIILTDTPLSERLGLDEIFINR